MDFKDKYEAYEKSNRIEHIADEETAERLGIKVGEIYTTFPPPDTKEKAWEKLKQYTSLIHLEALVKEFKRNFPLNLRTLNDELAELQKFINEAETYSTVDAFKDNGTFFQIRYFYEYLKLKYDYYKNAEFGSDNFFSGYAEHVYGKYFVYKKWIEDRIKELTPKPIKQNMFPVDYEKFQKKELKGTITIFETIKRELNTYHWIFKSQFESRSTEMVIPMIHEDGRYCPRLNLHSNRKLNRIEKYKSHYTERFENGKKSIAVENELFEIYQKAVTVRDFFNSNLTNANPVVNDIAESFITDYSIEHRDQHTLEAIIINFQVQDIVFEHDSLHDSHTSDWLRGEFNYSITNRELAQHCQNLISFIDNFEIEKIFKLNTNEGFVENFSNTENVSEKNMHNMIFKSNAFEVFEKFKELKAITNQSRTDLRVIFDLLKRDNLLVDTIELKHFIKWLNDTYFHNDLGSELRIQNLKSKPNIIRTNEYEQIKSSTLKLP